MTDERDPGDIDLTALADHDDAPPPNPRFVRDLRGTLMKQASALSPAGSLPGTAGPARDTARVANTRPGYRDHPFDRRVILHLAAVALLLLAWAGTLAGGGPRNIFNAATDSNSDPSTAFVFRGNNARTGVVDERGPEANPQLAWSIQPSRAGFVVAGATDETIILTYQLPTQVVAIDRETGTERWSVTTGPGCLTDTTPLIAGGVVYIATSCENEGLVIAVSESDGAERWRYQTGGSIVSSPMVEDDLLFVMAYDGQTSVVALDATDGAERWNAPVTGALASPAVTPAAGTVNLGKSWPFSPAIGDGMIFVTAFDGTLSALSLADGSEVWRYGTNGTVITTPAYDDGALYFSATTLFDNGFDSRLIAVDAASGAERWVVDAPGHMMTNGPTVAGGLVFQPATDGKAFWSAGYDAGTGEERWRIDRSGSMTYAGGVLYLLDQQRGDALAIDPDTGTLLWAAFIANYEFGGEVGIPNVSDPIIIDGHLIAGRMAETVIAISGGPSDSGAVSSPVAPGTHDFSGLAPCAPRAPVDWQSLTGEPAMSLVPVNQNQREGLPAAILPDELPQGTAATPETEAAIAATIEEMRRCIGRIGQQDLSGYFSEDFFRRTWVRVALSMSPDWYPGQFLSFVESEEAAISYRLLPDGRIGVEFRIDPNFAYFPVFVEQDGQWVLDELLQITPFSEGKG